MSHQITVVVPVFNRAKAVAATLRSIAEQEGADFCIIAVDNGSTDGTLQVLRECAYAFAARGVEMLVASQPKPGACAARNAGLRLVTSPWVMFFDSDDTMLPGHLARITRGIRESPDTDLLSFDVAYRMPDGTEKEQPSTPDMVTHLLHGSLSTLRWAARTELVRRAGGWDESLRGWDDLELGVRMLLLQPNALRLAGAPTASVDVHGDSITGADYSHAPSKWEDSLDRIEAHLSETPWLPLLRAVRAKLAALYRREGSRDLAARQLRKALDGMDFRRRCALLAVYRVLLTFGHGGSFVAKLLLCP